MPRHFVVLGAGISGLATGWFLKKNLPPEDTLTIIEQTKRCGGWIQTLNQEGFLFEQGPRSCRTKGGNATLSLIEELGLASETIFPHKDSQKRFIFHNNCLQSLPRHIWQIPFNPLMQGWSKALWLDLFQPKRKEEDESIYNFFKRRLGVTWTNKIIDPFVLGIYAGDCRQLSLKSCFPQFDEWEMNSGSLFKGAMQQTQKRTNELSPFAQSMQKNPLFSFKKGMETLIHSLANELKPHIKFESEITQFIPASNGIKILLASGMHLFADHVISTIPAFALQPFFPSIHLNHLNYASVTVVNLGFEHMKQDRKGFGYLVPSSENSPVLGCVWDSSIFPSQNKHPSQTRWTLMFGGAKHPDISFLTDNEIIDLTMAALQNQCGVKQDPKIIQIKRAQSAIPQYHVGFQVWKERVMADLAVLAPSLTLSGSSFYGVSINDCISQAFRIVNRIAKI